MAFPNADANGVLTGKFTIPAGLPSGAKEVAFLGVGGSRGTATFIGEGTVQISTEQIVSTTTTTNTEVIVDPLAQTFTLPEDQMLGAVDLWFTAKGTQPVEVQIRETSNGFPGRRVLTSKRLAPADILVNGAHTRVTFPYPLPVRKDMEYALVILTNDAVAALAIAELGKFDANVQRWVTAQPYQIGVLLSSSNALTWTAHQDRDLAFRLITAAISNTSRTVALGSVAVTGATHLAVRANVESPAPQATCRFSLTMPDGTSYLVAADQTVRLPAAVTGNVTVAALLEGTAKLSPVLHRDVQLFAGTMGTTGDYVTRAIKGGTNVKVKLKVEVLLEGTATITAHYKGTADGAWSSLGAPTASLNLPDGYVELTYESAAITKPQIQAKLILNGNANNVPTARNLRVLTV